MTDAGTESSGNAAAQGEPVEGGTLRITNGVDVDYLDPSTAYSPVAWSLERGYVRLLYSWESSNDPEVAGRPVPDLAEGEPEVSEDGRTYTFTLGRGSCGGLLSTVS